MGIDLLLWVALWISPQAASRPTAAVRPTAAMLDRVSCQATLRRAGSARPEPITERTRGTYLFVGDEVQCTSKTGYLTLILSSGEPKLLTSKDGTHKVLAPADATAPPRETRAATPRAVDSEIEKARKELAAMVARVLSHHGKRAATRGSASAPWIIYPAVNAVVLPERFVIRWNPELTSPQPRFSLWRVGGAQALWSDTQVDGRRGVLESTAAKEALGKAVSGGPNAQQLFVLQVQDKEPTAVPFRVLGTEDTQALNQELALWSQEKNELLRLLGRAYSFDVRQLFWEAAEEYRAAFDLTSSCDLLNEAVAASARAGDEAQERKLIERRPSFPGGCTDRHR